MGKLIAKFTALELKVAELEKKFDEKVEDIIMSGLTKIDNYLDVGERFDKLEKNLNAVNGCRIEEEKRNQLKIENFEERIKSLEAMMGFDLDIYDKGFSIIKKNESLSTKINDIVSRLDEISDKIISLQDLGSILTDNHSEHIHALKRMEARLDGCRRRLTKKVKDEL